MKKTYLKTLTGLSLSALMLISCSKDNDENLLQENDSLEENLFRKSDGYTDLDFYNHVQNNPEVHEIPKEIEIALNNLDENNFLAQVNSETTTLQSNTSQKLTNAVDHDCFDFFINFIDNQNKDNGWLGYGWVYAKSSYNSSALGSPDIFSVTGTHDASMFSVTTFGNWGNRNAIQSLGFTLAGYLTKFSIFSKRGIESIMVSSQEILGDDNNNPEGREDIQGVRFYQPEIMECLGGPSTALLFYRVHTYSEFDNSPGSWSDFKTGGDWAIEPDFTPGAFAGLKTIDGIQFYISYDNHFYVQD